MIGHADLFADERLRTNNGRVSSQEWMLPRLRADIVKFTSAELQQKLERASVPYAPVQRPDVEALIDYRASNRRFVDRLPRQIRQALRESKGMRLVRRQAYQLNQVFSGPYRILTRTNLNAHGICILRLFSRLLKTTVVARALHTAREFGRRCRGAGHLVVVIGDL